MKSRISGVGLISGGLDSLLAVEILKRQRLALQGLHFLNGYEPGSMKSSVENGLSMGDIAAGKRDILLRKIGIGVDVIDISGEFLAILNHPRHGFGRNINPCIDCRIFLLRKAKERMEALGADFVFTGEVLGQRPMSQHLGAMKIVERESGLEGRLLRPLSARLLPPTAPEAEGIVDREKLLDIHGRSRKRQMALASELGIADYPVPAGGCMLTDENYARRFADMREQSGWEGLDYEEMVLLSVGRHFRISPKTKLVVGRRESENNYLERAWGGHWLATTPDHPGPVTLVLGEPDDEDFRKAAALTARYSDGKGEPMVRVAFTRGGESMIIEIGPSAGLDLADRRI